MNKKIYKSLIIKIVIALIIVINLNSIIGYQKSQAVTNTTLSAEEQEKYNNYLSNLSVSNYQITPEFNKNTTTYYITIPEDIMQVEVIANTENENAKIKITGETKLTKTENTIIVNVTSEKGIVRTYKIIATKQEDNGLKLTELNIENAEGFTPTFSENTYYYEAKINLNEDIKKLNITTKANKTNAKIEIIGNDISTLKSGENLITIIVKNGEDVTTYQVNININVSKFMVSDDSSNNLNKTINLIIEKIKEFFADEDRKIAFLTAIAVILMIIIIRLIIKIAKRNKENNIKKSV